MSRRVWDKQRLPPDDNLWELFHENSKLSRWDPMPPDEYVEARMRNLSESLCYSGYPVVALSRDLCPMTASLETAVLGRVTARPLRPRVIRLDELSTLLHLAYGRTRTNEGTPWPRPFRVVPSAGAMYPLELYVYTAHVEGLGRGCYHFDPVGHCLRLLKAGDATAELAEALVQPEVALGASAIVFLTAIFERMTFKYGDRGYRFVFLEAGHVAQNLNLVSTALGLGSIDIGGYRDRMVDDFLGLDGVEHSTVYLVALGAGASESD